MLLWARSLATAVGAGPGMHGLALGVGGVSSSEVGDGGNHKWAGGDFELWVPGSVFGACPCQQGLASPSHCWLPCCSAGGGARAPWRFQQLLPAACFVLTDVFVLGQSQMRAHATRARVQMVSCRICYKLVSWSHTRVSSAVHPFICLSTVCAVAVTFTAGTRPSMAGRLTCVAG